MISCLSFFFFLISSLHGPLCMLSKSNKTRLMLQQWNLILNKRPFWFRSMIGVSTRTNLLDPDVAGAFSNVQICLFV